MSLQVHARRDARHRRRNPARARRRWAAACCASTSRHAGAIDYRRAGRQRRRPRARPTRQTLKACRREIRMIFQDPVGSLNPRMTVAQIIGRAAAGQRHRQGQGARRPRRGPDAAGRARARLARALSARLLRRPAPAHRHRPRHRAQPAPHRGRRGDLGARRFAALADARPDDAAAGRARPLPMSSSATTWRSSATCATASR